MKYYSIQTIEKLFSKIHYQMFIIYHLFLHKPGQIPNYPTIIELADVRECPLILT
jgi:hypothetical protein